MYRVALKRVLETRYRVDYHTRRIREYFKFLPLGLGVVWYDGFIHMHLDADWMG